MTETIIEAVTNAPLVPTARTPRGSGLLVPLVKSLAHLTVAYIRTHDTDAPALGEINNEIADADAHFRDITVPTAFLSTVAKQAIATMQIQITALIQDIAWANQTEPMSESMRLSIQGAIVRLWEQAAILDTELIGTPNPDPGRQP